MKALVANERAPLVTLKCAVLPFILPAGAARSQTTALTGIIVSGAVQLTVDLQRYSSMELL